MRNLRVIREIADAVRIVRLDQVVAAATANANLLLRRAGCRMPGCVRPSPADLLRPRIFKAFAASYLVASMPSLLPMAISAVASEAEPPGTARVFEGLAEKLTLAREALNTLSDRYLKPLRERNFDRPSGQPMLRPVIDPRYGLAFSESHSEG